MTRAARHGDRTPSGTLDALEEGLVALLLGLMTAITFANVVARYVFNDNLLWALEATVFLFAWLVLLGTCYGVKKSLHLGVDIVVSRTSAGTRRALGLVAVAASFAFGALMLVGSWNYWYPFATEQAFFEVNDIPMPGFLQFLADWMNEGERYEKMPKFIPYAVLPLSMALFTWRFFQAGRRMLAGEIDLIIASHEAEDRGGEPAA